MFGFVLILAGAFYFFGFTGLVWAVLGIAGFIAICNSL